MPPKIETYPFRCTAREARKIQDNLRYTSAARELADAAQNLIHNWENNLTDSMQRLNDSLAMFQLIADE